MQYHSSGTLQLLFRLRQTLLLLNILVLTFVVAMFSPAAYGDDGVTIRREKLWRLEQEFRVNHDADRQAAIGYAQKHGLPLRRQLENGTVIQLMAVRNNLPLYYKTMNVDAADTVGADELWPGGSTPYGLSGSGILLGIWDGGPVRTTHQEFGGRATLKDGSPYSGFHATHVGGTMIAEGINPNAKGMAYAARLNSYDWDCDDAEMASAALEGLQVSNHSYGYAAGWDSMSFQWDDGQVIEWLWWGDPSINAKEDYKFGYYDLEARHWDALAYNAPEYLIVKSAGNDRDEGPIPNTPHLVIKDGFLVLSQATRNTDGGPDGYDSIVSNSLAKNILTVGAVEDIVGGYTGPEDVVMSSFSGWGPTDDGRIKPDICANGVDLTSTAYYGDEAYWGMSGTSMSSPSAAGTLGLLLEQYLDKRLVRPRASTLKALVIHSANEAGDNPGPDYVFGWGLLNAVGAADTIQSANTGTALILEETLVNGGSFSLDVDATGLEPLKVTIVWTDPAGKVVPPALDPSDKMLVHDLDLRVTQDVSTYEPWVLDGANPSDAATTGDNNTDNVEQVVVDIPVAGTHQIVVNHKGNLSESQDFTIIVTGVEVPTYELVIQSSPETEIQIDGTHSGITDLVHEVPENFPVVLIAPKQSGSLHFSRWKDDGDVTLTCSRTYSFVMSENTTVVAEYTYRVPSTTVFGWGLNAWGQVGDGTQVQRLVPTATEDIWTVSQLAGGRFHSLGLTPDGDVLAWGSNADGQLGYDTCLSGEWHEPGDLLGASNVIHPILGISNVVQVAAGMNHSLAVDGDGFVWAWGRNLSGQLGDGTLVGSCVPTQVVDLTDVVQVAAGEYHSVALKSDGTVWAWGSNAWGQLGDNRGGLTMDTYIGHLTPLQVSLPSGVVITDIVAGASHTLALAEDGTVYGWGANCWGQLGSSCTEDAWTPVQVCGLTNVVTITAGSFHSLAIDADGNVWAWGANWWGQLGDSTFACCSWPKEVAGLPDAVQVAAGENHSAIRTVDNEVYAWGWNHNGQLGNDTTIDSWQPVLASNLENVDYLASGAWHLLASAPFPYEPLTPPTAHAGLLSTGLNSDGQLGLSDDENRNVFTRAPDIDRIVMVDGGDLHTVALMRNGTVWTCGSNDWGQLGMGDNEERNTFTQVTTLPDVTPVAVEAGAYYTLVLDDEGDVWACGRNSWGELGLGEADDSADHNSFVRVPGLSRIHWISAGGHHSFALKDDATLWTVGRNDHGQLGIDDMGADQHSYTLVPDVMNIRSVATGSYFSMLLKNDGTVWTCGDNSEGQLGQDGSGDLAAFTQVAGLSNITKAAAGLAHAFVLDGDGNIWAAGRNSSGQLGLGDLAQRDSFVQVTSVTNVESITAAGGNHSLAIDAGEKLWVCGNNTYGQLGLGDDERRTAFTLLPGEKTVLWAAAGENHSVVMGRLPVEWTVMVYLDADNNLEEAGLQDFLEMAETGGGDDVNVVALFDRAGGYSSSYGNWTDTRRGGIRAGDVPDASWGESIGEANMGDPDTLVDFVNWAVENYPAERYALVLWNHGDGWYQSEYEVETVSGQTDMIMVKSTIQEIRANATISSPVEAPSIGDVQTPVLSAVCVDDGSGGDALSMGELRDALANISSTSVAPNLVGFDACLMGMAEVAYEIRDYAEVMVGSEEVVPGDGWPYAEILAQLGAMPTMNASDFGTAIVLAYAGEYAGYGYDGVTHAALDLTMMDTLADDIDTFAQTMWDHWEDDETAVKDAAQAVIDTLDNTIIREWHNGEVPGSNGLAIYFPSEPFHYDETYDGSSGVLSFSADHLWDDFVNEFYEYMLDTWIGTARYQSQQYVDSYWYYGAPLPSYVHTDLRDFCERIVDYDAPEEFYVETLEDNDFQNVGGAQEGWTGLDDYWEYPLPFTFPFFGEDRTTIWVSSHGYVDLSPLSDHIDWTNNTVKLLNNERIAPLWTDLIMDQVYVNSPDEDTLIIRWEGWEFPQWGGEVTINFELVLQSNGVIKFNYGEGNELDGIYTFGYDEPTIGISRGNGVDYYLSSHNQLDTLGDLETQVFTPSGMEGAEETTVESSPDPDAVVDDKVVPPASGVGDAWVFGGDADDEGAEGSDIVLPPLSAEATSDGETTDSSDQTTEEAAVATDIDAIVDNRDNSKAKQFKRLSGDWPVSTLASGHYGRDYTYARARSGPENSRARFSCTTLAGGRYNVYAWWSARSDRGENVAYEILHDDGVTTVRVNQKENGGQWILLGDYDFAAGTHVVEIHNGLSDPGSFVCADAIRFELIRTVSTSTSTSRALYRSVPVVVEDERKSASSDVVSGLVLRTPCQAGLEVAPGTMYPITWDSAGLPVYAPIEISLHRGGEFVKRLIGTPNTGRWVWHVGYDQRGDAYTIRVNLAGYSDVIGDESDNEFVIALPGEW